MITVEEALKRILDEVAPLGMEQVNILDALGRVIGEDVYAGRAIPPWANSAMDGYALRAADTRWASAESPVGLAVVEEIPAGRVPRKMIGKGQASRIMTGAPIPEGADAVVPMEDTRKEAAGVLIFVEAAEGQHIRRAGEDVAQGEKVLSRGALIRPAEVAMLVALGRAFISCHQRPVVAIVPTGDEIEEIDGPRADGKIISSNSYALAALVRQAGAIPIRIGIARDNREDLAAKFAAAMRADLIVSTGGVSVGDYDLVKEIMKEAGNRMHFWQVAMRPGRPLAFGTLGSVPIIALPGNPGASIVAFEVFIRPAILKMRGHANLFRSTIRARLDEAIRKKRPGMRHFIWARVRRDGEAYAVAPTGAQGYRIFTSMLHANSLIVLPEDASSVPAGDMVTVQLLDDSLWYGSRNCRRPFPCRP